MRCHDEEAELRNRAKCIELNQLNQQSLFKTWMRWLVTLVVWIAEMTWWLTKKKKKKKRIIHIYITFTTMFLANKLNPKRFSKLFYKSINVWKLSVSFLISLTISTYHKPLITTENNQKYIKSISKIPFLKNPWCKHKRNTAVLKKVVYYSPYLLLHSSKFPEHPNWLWRWH